MAKLVIEPSLHPRSPIPWVLSSPLTQNLVFHGRTLIQVALWKLLFWLARAKALGVDISSWSPLPNGLLFQSKQPPRNT